MGSFGVWLVSQMLTYFVYAPLCASATILKIASQNKFFGKRVDSFGVWLALQMLTFFCEILAYCATEQLIHEKIG